MTSGRTVQADPQALRSLAAALTRFTEDLGAAADGLAAAASEAAEDIATMPDVVDVLEQLSSAVRQPATDLAPVGERLGRLEGTLTEYLGRNGGVLSGSRAACVPPGPPAPPAGVAGSAAAGEPKGAADCEESAGATSGVLWEPGDVPEEYATLVAAAERHTSGRKGSRWNKELNNPKPNKAYIVDNKFLFVTDHLGRTVYVKAILTRDGLHDGVDRRHKSQQSEAGRRRYDEERGKRVRITDDDNLDGRIIGLDDGGHLIGAQFGGIGEGINLVAQHSDLNQQRISWPDNWFAAESHVVTLLETPPCSPVAWEVQLAYPDDSMRPEEFMLRYQQENGEAFEYSWENPLE